MPDPTTTHPVDALLPVIRAALLRAYDHGASDAVQKLVAQIAPQPSLRGRPRGAVCRAPYGSLRAAIRNAIGADEVTVRDVADAVGIKYHKASTQLVQLAQAGEIVRVAPGRYARATQVQS